LVRHCIDTRALDTYLTQVGGSRSLATKSSAQQWNEPGGAFQPMRRSEQSWAQEKTRETKKKARTRRTGQMNSGTST
jgi:hypothetical protein